MGHAVLHDDPVVQVYTRAKYEAALVAVESQAGTRTTCVEVRYASTITEPGRCSSACERCLTSPRAGLVDK